MPERRTGAREWALALAGGLALAAALVALLRPAPAPPAPPPLPAAPVPIADPVAEAAPPPPAMAAAPPVLRGVLGPDAVILETGDGRQRLLRRGGGRVAGLALVAVSPAAARLEDAAGGQMVLALEGTSLPDVQPAPEPAVQGLRRVRRAELAASATDYRLALSPLGQQRNSGQSRDITGWTVRDAAAVPLLRLAGLQPGDVLTTVNGQLLFSEEKLIDLPDELAGATVAELEYLRRGARNTVRLEIVD